MLTPCVVTAPVSRWRLLRAARLLRQGGVLACPTEAVWGLSCDPTNRQAVERLLEMKQRAAAQGLILIAGGMAQLEPLLRDLPPSQRDELEASWPGPVTWLIPHHGRVPHWISGRHATVAVRVTAHPVAAALCQAFGGMLVSTSANPHRRPPARDRLQLLRYFGAELDEILPGALGGAARPSQIRDLASGRQIRD